MNKSQDSCISVKLAKVLLALLQAISERLIPGLSNTLTIASLQQIDVDDNDKAGTSSQPVGEEEDTQQRPEKDLSSLDYVLHNDASRDDTLREFNGLCTTNNFLSLWLTSRSTALSKVIDDDSRAQIKVFREIKFARLQARLDQMRRAANLRSGSRGFKARKELAGFEVQVNEASQQ